MEVCLVNARRVNAAAPQIVMQWLTVHFQALRDAFPSGKKS